MSLLCFCIQCKPCYLQRLFHTSVLVIHNPPQSHNSLQQTSTPQAQLAALDSWVTIQRTWQQYTEKTSPFPVQKKQIISINKRSLESTFRQLLTVLTIILLNLLYIYILLFLCSLCHLFVRPFLD